MQETITVAPEERVAKCPQCGTGASWLGVITPDMIENTFTRGVTPEGVPYCPRCGTVMEPVLAEADTSTASGREPKQPVIPGLAPVFNFEFAFRSIIDQRRSVREAEERAEQKSEAAKSAKKRAEAEQEKLSAMEDEYAERAGEREYWAESEAIARRVEACAFERATGIACVICREYPADLPIENTAPDHVATAVYNLASRGELTAAALKSALELSASITTIALGTIEEWDPETRKAVAAWLALRDTTERPAVLGGAEP